MLSGQLNNDSLSMEKSEENLTTVDNRSLESSSCPPLEKQGGEKDQAEKVEC